MSDEGIRTFVEISLPAYCVAVFLREETNQHTRNNSFSYDALFPRKFTLKIRSVGVRLISLRMYVRCRVLFLLVLVHEIQQDTTDC